MTDHILTDLTDRVLTIRFNRPDKKNACTQAMYDKMANALDKAKDDAEVRVILFAGQPDCFCSGNDIQDFLSLPPATADSPVARFMNAVATCPKPLIAAPCGVGVGIGVTLLWQCDLVYMGEATKLHASFVRLGICPELASTYVVPRLMGYQRAAELLLTGRPFDAKKAYEYGMVNEVLPNAEVEARARATAVEIAQLPPNAVRTTKKLMRQWTQETSVEAIKVEADYFVPMLRMPEALEALTAFMQKRKPDFSKFA